MPFEKNYKPSGLPQLDNAYIKITEVIGDNNSNQMYIRAEVFYDKATHDTGEQPIDRIRVVIPEASYAPLRDSILPSIELTALSNSDFLAGTTIVE